MPYHLEKGSFMIAMEDWLNQGLDPQTAGPSTARTTAAVQNRVAAYNLLIDMLYKLATNKPAPTVVEVLAPLFAYANAETAQEANKANVAPPQPWDLKLGVYFMGLKRTGNGWE